MRRRINGDDGGFWVKVCDGLQHVCNTLASSFGGQSVLERRCGSLNLLRDLFGHRSCHHPPRNVADHNLPHTSFRFAESCDASQPDGVDDFIWDVPHCQTRPDLGEQL